MQRGTTSMEASNTDVVRAYFDAARSGDLEKLSAIMADDIVWHQPGSSGLSGTYRGRNEVIKLFMKFVQLSQGTFKIDEVETVMGNGDLVSAILHFKAERPGEKMAMKGVDVMRVDDGKIKEVWLFSADQRAEDRFWGR